MLELEALFVQLFPEASRQSARGEPFTLCEIADVLSEAYRCRISYRNVHRAFAWLINNPVSTEAVHPLDCDGRELQFSAKAARRIARRVVGSKLPAKYKTTLRMSKNKMSAK